MEKTFENVAIILVVVFAAISLVNLILGVVLLSRGTLELTLSLLTGIDLVVFFLFAILNDTWRHKILENDQRIVTKLAAVRLAYQQWLKDHNLTELISRLERFLGD